MNSLYTSEMANLARLAHLTLDITESILSNKSVLSAKSL